VLLCLARVCVRTPKRDLRSTTRLLGILSAVPAKLDAREVIVHVKRRLLAVVFDAIPRNQEAIGRLPRVWIRSEDESPALIFESSRDDAQSP
jgi:hypothetical protein